MPLNRFGSWGLALLAVGAPNPCAAAEPEVSINATKGSIEFALKQDGAPVPGATVQVYAERGHKFAAGETDDEGRGEFPLPNGSSFTVEIKVGKRVADPIRLQRTDEGVEPAHVLLSFGLRPCCRVAARSKSSQPVAPAPSEPASLPVWLQAVAGTGFLLFGATLLLLVRRPSPLEPDLPPGDVS